MKIPWVEGECGECGDKMKVLDVVHYSSEACKQCKLLAKFERIAYALECQVGLE